MQTIQLGTARARPGQKAWGQLRVTQNGQTAALPVVVINGKKPGGHIVLMANQHGIEVNGVESLRRLCEEVDPRQVSGTIFVIISANPNAAMLGSQVDSKTGNYKSRYNMNWIWPGRVGGLLVERVVHELWNKAIMAPHAKASFVLDIHCWAITTPTAALAEVECKDFGVATGLRNIILTHRLNLYRHKPRSWYKKQVHPAFVSDISIPCLRAGIQFICVELSGQSMMVPASIAEGLMIVRNLLKYTGSLPGSPELPGETVLIDPYKGEFLTKKKPHLVNKAKKAGLYVPRKQVYDLVRKGEVLGEIVDPHTGRVVQQVLSRSNGAIFDVTAKAACAPGDRVVRVARAWIINPKSYLRRRPNHVSRSR